MKIRNILEQSKLGLASALVACSAANAATAVPPDALLQVDLNRSAVAERIMSSWSGELAAAQRPALQAKLMQLRADQLLAANVSGSFNGVLEIVQAHEGARANGLAEISAFAERAKAIGEIDKDLVYTPISPCRFLDTRGVFSPVFAGGAYAANETRTYQATGNCSVPAGAQAVVTQIIMITPPAAGDIELLPQGGTFGNTVAMVFLPNAYSSVSLIARLNGSNGQFATQVRGQGGHVAMDVTGYFMPPTRAGNGLRISQTTGPFADSPNMTGGSIANAASAQGGVVLGGGHSATNCYDTVTNQSNRSCGNQARNDFATIVGGYANVASGDSSTLIGGVANTASGRNATIAGGAFNTASGESSFAAGSSARATGKGHFVWADSSAPDFPPVGSTAFGGNFTNVFQVRATGGVEFVTNIDANTGATLNGCRITGGTAATSGWNCFSDRELKQNIRAIRPQDVLAKLVAMPVTTWSMLGSNVVQMGPMSQDFRKAFGLGASERYINSVDAQGVAFAAIQGLHQNMSAQMAKLTQEARAKDAKISALEKSARELEILKAEMAAMKKKLGL